ncbi:MAG: hypothetical protein HC896_06830 [Bacteroidales bacterium]|nr:hypothetical protein [Bacteroidales bacterium]
MLFNSFSFLVYFPIVFLVYWLWLYNKPHLNSAFLLVVSYVFYGWWDYRFLSLIFISSITDYLIGYLLVGQHKKATRQILLAISIVVNLGFC